MNAHSRPAAITPAPFSLAPLDFGLYATTVFFWGISWYALKFQIGVVAPEVSVAYRFAAAATIMFAIVIVTKRRLVFPLTDHLRFAALGLFLFSTNFTMFYYAAGYLISGLLAVVITLAVVFNIVLSAILFRTPIEGRVALGALLGIFGVGLLVWPEIARTDIGAQVLIGLGFSVAGTVSFSLGNMVSASIQARGLPNYSSTAWGMFYGATALTLVALISGSRFNFDFSVGYISTMAYLVVCGSVLVFICYLTLLGRIGSSRASYATVMFPVVALIVSGLFEGYQWSLFTVAGLTCAIAGNVLVMTARRK